jgi:hypothetical protein
VSNWLVGELGGEMFDWLASEENDAVGMLKSDHNRVKALFEQFETAEHKAEKQKIAKQAIEELRIHSAIEEELFYPAVREHLKNGVMNEADEEHHVAKLLIAELDALNADNDHFDAKFTVLAESVRHHIKEEENDMLPKARDLPIDFQALREKMERRRAELKTTGLPPTPEDAMVRKVRTKAPVPTKKPATVIKPAAMIK